MPTDLVTIPGQFNFQEFISELKSGNRNMDHLLPGKHSFEEMPFEQLLSNINDLEAGVNRVQTNVSSLCFNLFNAVQVKHHDHNDTTIELFAFYPSPEEVKKIVGTLFDEFGVGRFHRSPGRRGDDVPKFDLNSFISCPEEEVTHMWDWKDLMVAAEQMVKPVRHLSVRIAIKGTPKIDHSPRKHTILKFLTLDVIDILSKEPVEKKLSSEKGLPQYVEYTYPLEQKQFNLFDLITIWIYDEEKMFSKDTTTHITFHSKDYIQSKDKIEFAERLLRIFGSDHVAGEELMRIEKIVLRKRGFWPGRTWSFNRDNGLRDRNNPEEKEWYSMVLNDVQIPYQFQLTIHNYNKLIAHAGTT